MCLGVPGRITEIWQENDGALMAQADFAGESKKICLNYLPTLEVGDYVIIHAGFALTRLDEAEATQTLAVMREYGVLAEEVS
jgi:hydrogenase expression/formation protein HypC